jgi:hypothetical protein
MIKIIPAFSGAVLVGAIALLAQGAHGQSVIYNDTTNFQGDFSYGTNLQVGNEIILASPFDNYLITSFGFQFFFTGTGSPSGSETADLRIYLNNAAPVDGYASPGALLYDSGAFSLGSYTTGSVATFNQATLNGGIGVPPYGVTWTVSFAGLTAGESAGLALFSPATVGENYDDAWINTNGTTWQLEVSTNGNPPDDFGAIAYGHLIPGFGVQPDGLLTIQKSGTKVVLSWNDPAFVLTASPTLNGTYTNVVGATSPYTNPIVGLEGFFQLSGQFPTNDLNGLALWWAFDAGSGSTAADSSGHGNTGTLNGNPTWTNGIISNALSFNGSSQSVTGPNPLAGSGPITVCVWIKGSSPGANATATVLSSGLSYGFMFYSGGGVRFVGDGSWFDGIGPSTTCDDGNWHFLVGTWTGGTGSFYVDGVLQASQSMTMQGYNTVTVAAPGFYSGYYSGTIDDVRVYNRVLSAGEIENQFQWPTGNRP